MKQFKLESKQSRKITYISNANGDIDILLNNEYTTTIEKKWYMRQEPKYIWTLNFLQPLCYALKKANKEELNSFEIEQINELSEKLFKILFTKKQQEAMIRN